MTGTQRTVDPAGCVSSQNPVVVTFAEYDDDFVVDDTLSLLTRQHRVCWVGEFAQCSQSSAPQLVGKRFTAMAARDSVTGRSLRFAVPFDLSIVSAKRVATETGAVVRHCGAAPSPHPPPLARTYSPWFHYFLGHGMIRVHIEPRSDTGDRLASARQNAVVCRPPSLPLASPRFPDGKFVVPQHTEIWFFVPHHIEEFTLEWPAQQGHSGNLAGKAGKTAEDSPRIPPSYLAFQRGVMASARLFDGRWSAFIRKFIDEWRRDHWRPSRTNEYEPISSTQYTESIGRLADYFDRMMQTDTDRSSARWRNFGFERAVAGDVVFQHRFGCVPAIDLACWWLPLAVAAFRSSSQ